VRIATYNVRYFGHGLKGLASTAGSKARISGALVDLSPLPELVALQEVETRSLRSSAAPRSVRADETQLDAFLRHLTQTFHERGLVNPYRAFYFPAHVYGVGAFKLYTTGLAILVNTAKLNVIADNGAEPHRITHLPPRLSRMKQTRIAAHLHLEDEHGKRFHLFNTHLSLPSFWAREFWSQPAKMGFGVNQLAEAEAIAQYAKVTSNGEPYMIVGDFNTAPGSPVYEQLTRSSGLMGAQEFLKQIDLKNPTAFSTAGFMHLRMHLDHVFGSGLEFTELEDTKSFSDVKNRFAGLSDHVPIVAGFHV
jgi:endonuclease/exonuclease/phosphatase family metal-dependent hydrolase